jgi:hypothetical protein
LNRVVGDQPGQQRESLPQTNAIQHKAKQSKMPDVVAYACTFSPQDSEASLDYILKTKIKQQQQKIPKQNKKFTNTFLEEVQILKLLGKVFKDTVLHEFKKLKENMD